jgi:hypothetical protein
LSAATERSKCADPQPACYGSAARRTGSYSISKASKALDLSYRHVWGALKAEKKTLTDR